MLWTQVIASTALLAVPSVLAATAEKVNVVPVDPDVGLDVPAIIKSKGYPVEQYSCTTDDGYILGMFRIPRAGARPVLLQHGLLDSAFTWVGNFADQSLAYIMYDAGYDVWLGNNRGNTWSKAHTTYSVDSDEFWDFSWDHMAHHDFPSMIQCVLDTTEQPKLAAYVGHSEGTIQAFSGLSLEQNKKVADSINLFVALAPVAYVSHQKSPLFNILADLDTAFFFQLLGLREFLPTDGFIAKIAPGMCHLIPHGCDFFLAFLCGPTNNLNDTRIQVYVSQTPAGTSVKNMRQWTQGVKHNTFQMFDYGTRRLNRQHYGTDNPPQYNLSAVHVPTALFYGDHDWLADPKDVQQLISELPAETIVYQDEQTDYAHLDYTWAYGAGTRIYSTVVNLVNQYNN